LYSKYISSEVVKAARYGRLSYSITIADCSEWDETPEATSTGGWHYLGSNHHDDNGSCTSARALLGMNLIEFQTLENERKGEDDREVV
jgi:hypothetical protein